MTASVMTHLCDIWSWGAKRHPKIFISYRRRGEGAGYGGRVADNLVEHFGAGQCFRDVDDIESGVDFVKTIHGAVGACQVLVAVIGPDWISQVDAAGNRRLDDPKDFVRLEVAAALERDIRVIPVLVGGAPTPAEHQLPDVLKGLSRRQSHELSDSRWEYDVKRLLGTIESIGIRRNPPAKPPAFGRMWKAAAGLSAAGAIGLASAWIGWVPAPEATPGHTALPALSETLPEVETPAGSISQQQIESELERKRNEKEELKETRNSAAANESPDSKLNGLVSASEILDRIAGMAPLQAVSGGKEEAFRGLYEELRITWKHEGIVYDAVATMNGRHGIAVVTYDDPLAGTRISVEQDLDLVRNAEGDFYVGSNPRFAATGVPNPFYAPDIFKLTMQRNGGFTIGAVGDQWDHFDQAVVR